MRVMRKVLHRLVIFLSGTSKNAGKGPFCKVDAGARLFFHEKMAVARPRARLGASTAITKKELVSVRVMRKVLHRLVIFLSGTSKNAGKGPFCKVDAGARLFFHEKVAVARPRARLGASTAITKKNWCLYA